MDSELVKAIESVHIPKKDFADLRITGLESTSVSVRKGEVEQVSSQKAEGAAARALVDGAWGFVYTTDCSKNGLVEALNNAIKSARVTSQRSSQPVEIYREGGFEATIPLRVAIDPRDIPLEKKVVVALEFDRNIRAAGPEVTTTSVSLSDSVKKERIVNTLGVMVEYEVCGTRLGGMATVKEGELLQNVMASVGESRGWETIEGYDVVNEGLKLGKRGISLLSAKAPPSGTENVIMDQSLVGVYIHEAFGHASEADAVKANRSILAGKLGEKIGSDRITVIDDPTLQGARGSFPYDSEGTKAKRRTIVKEGLLKEFLHSLETAYFMGTEPNGAARAQDFSSKPIVRMSNTYIERGDMSVEELAECIKEGIMLIESYGGYVDPARGQFYFTAQEGKIVRNGELCEPTQNVSMSGLTLEVLKNVIGVGKDLKIAFPGTCGKEGQWVPVAGGGPPVAVKNIVVGGRGT